MPWDYFDAVFCISLDERPDRRAQARAQFQRVGLADRAVFHVTPKHPTNIEQGIYESHMACLRKGLDAGAQTIVVFEDDILFERFDAKTLQNAVDFLAGRPDWNIFFFGCLVKASRKTGCASVLRVRHRTLAHAYAVNRKFAEILVGRPWDGLPFDDLLSARSENAYAAYPSFAFQSDSRSDNEKFLPLDRFRRLCGGLRRLQKMNEAFHRRRPVIIALHVLFALVVVWLLFFDGAASGSLL